MIILILFSIIIVHSFIFTKLIYFPYPELFVYPYLTNHGLKPYQQILDQHFPGLMFLPINFDNLGMNNEISARIASIAIIILIHFLLFFISYKILKSKQKALLVNFLFLLWQPFFEGWVLWIDSFLPLILLPAFYAIFRNKFFLCGLLLGLGIVFKQTLIPLSFLVIVYTLWKGENIKQLFIGLSIPIALMILYLVSIGVLADFWYWTIVFNVTIFAKFGTSAPATLGFVTRVLLVYSASSLLWFHKDKRLVQIVFLFLIGSLMGVDRADFVHFQPSLPFVLLATTLGVYSIKQNNLIKIGILIYIIVSFAWQKVFYSGHISDKVLFFDEQTKQTALKIRQYTNIGEKIFIFGSVPHLYQMADRLPPGDVFVFPFPWFLKIAQGRILEGIIQDKPNIIVSDRTVRIEGQPITEFAVDIDQYILKNYDVIDQIGTTSILRRKK